MFESLQLLKHAYGTAMMTATEESAPEEGFTYEEQASDSDFE
jgi:hypothetical protein